MYRYDRSTALRALLALLPLLVASCATQDPSRAGIEPPPLYGMIYDGGNRPVLGARVAVQGRAEEATSDINGRFVLNGLPSGTYGLSIAAVGYEPYSCYVEFLDGTQVVYVKLASLEDLLEAATQQLSARKLGEARTTLERALGVGPEDTIALYLAALERYLSSDTEGAIARLDQIRARGVLYPAVDLLTADVEELLRDDPAAAAGALRHYLTLRWDPEIEARAKALEGKAAQAAAPEEEAARAAGE